jgi:hypothetical protein
MQPRSRQVRPLESNRARGQLEALRWMVAPRAAPPLSVTVNAPRPTEPALAAPPFPLESRQKRGAGWTPTKGTERRPTGAHAYVLPLSCCCVQCPASVARCDRASGLIAVAARGVFQEETEETVTARRRIVPNRTVWAVVVRRPTLR